MKTLTTSLLLAAALLPLHPAGAQSILDQQLDNKPAEEQKAADTTPPAKPPEPTPTPSPVPAMVNPDATKAVDDSELVKKLTNSAPDQNPDDKMKEMLDRMNQSQSRLSDKDVGPITQETQRRIVTDLDVMIELARQQQQQQSQSQSKSSQQKGDQRQTTSGQQQGNRQGGNTSATSSQLPHGPVDAAQSNGQDMRQKGPAEWGGLPPKDRDVVSNGANEQYLPSYKEMIDRYYQALAEIGKSKDNH